MVTGKPLFTVNQIQEKVHELAGRISEDYAGRDLLVVSLLKGAFMFTADLVKNIRIPLIIDFMVVSSYAADRSTGEVVIHSDVRERVEGRDVLIVEDIIDSGTTLNYVREHVLQKNPRTLKICGLLDKRERRTVDVPIEYVGWEIPNLFVVGYGLDYDNKFRNLPYISVFKKTI
ncbi:MAG: hypoxanthine phosphoribosyltransferase [Nitrospirota bacterium]|jgi:hypoxanthine phosphoribosyltransferase